MVAFITASSYLDGVSMGGVRDMLRKAFDELWIMDLGGEGRGAQTEENVFDIRTPVAIAIAVRINKPDTPIGAVNYLKVVGNRADKFSKLSKIKLDITFTEIAGKALHHFTPRSKSRYYDWPEVTALLPWVQSGCKLNRTWPIAETKALLNRRWHTMLDEVPRNRTALLKKTGTREAGSLTSSLLTADEVRLPPIDSLDSSGLYESIERYGYRSFDRQWVIADNRVMDRPGPNLVVVSVVR